MTRFLESINSPADLKKIPLDQLPHLAKEMRELIMKTVGTNGGHLAPNLGTVEICLALNIVFNFPKDRLLWDVGHQCYPHKLLTGRYKQFHTLRKKGGICGFPDPTESPFDLFAVGHAGTSISTAVGMARADQLLQKNTKIVALVGDASIVNGLAFEGLNNAGTLGRQMLVILNDNSMSISEPQGAFANYLEHLRVTTTYEEVKKPRSASAGANSIWPAHLGHWLPHQAGHQEHPRAWPHLRRPRPQILRPHRRPRRQRPHRKTQRTQRPQRPRRPPRQNRQRQRLRMGLR